MIKKISSNYFNFFFIFFCAIVLFLALRGVAGNPTSSELNLAQWKENGPFELSPERGRFALTYSLVEDHSFQFSNNIGQFAQPDVATNKGRYVSLFAPVVSFIAIPGYVIGKYFGASQVGSFATIAIFALLNVLLLRLIAIRLGANHLAATVASLVFIFGTPAFAYAVNLYQHHISTFLILLSIYALLKSNKIWSLFTAFFLCAAAIPLDYPNLFFMFPIGVYALGRIISFENIKEKLSIKISLIKFIAPVIMILPVLFFLWVNQASYGNPFQLAGTLQNAESVPNTQIVSSVKTTATPSSGGSQKNVIGFFQTRQLVNGFYIHFISPDRGIIYYAPVVLFGLIGFFLAFQKKVKMVPLLGAVVGANILLYSMWGDPWGGWAFGSRYLIPSYAVLSIFIGLLLTYWKKKTWFLVLFTLVAFYSIAVNTLGAITTSALPPQVQVLALEKLSGTVQKYTYARSWDFLVAGSSKSFAYQTFLRPYLTTVEFYQILTIAIFLVVGGILVFYIVSSTKKGEDNV